MIWEGTTPADDPVAAADTVAPWADAGATWWLESDWAAGQGAAALDSFRRRLRAGPPRPA